MRAQTPRPKITIIGAGGYVFPFRLVGDILSFPALRDATICLMDIDADRLAPVTEAVGDLITHHGLGADLISTTDRREALDGADFVIITFQVGGIDAYRHDVEIPRRYGVDQPVGDTLGPGGVFRFLRSIAAYRELVVDARELCPDAQFINYANPMAMATAYLNALGAPTVGLCHSVQGTTRMLARTLDVDYDRVHYRCAGINHQAWVLEFRDGEHDLYPQLRDEMLRRHVRARSAGALTADQGDHSGEAGGASSYEGGNEQVRTAIMNAFGYFQTESSHHASEYVPWFRKNPQLIEEFIPQRWDYFDVCSSHDESSALDDQLAKLKQELTPSLEYGASIVNSMVTGELSVIHGNVPNAGGAIGNLPAEACVEVPCVVDRNGVQPTTIGELPPQLAALNRTNIGPQSLAVRAALTGVRENVHHAIALDPLTSALLTLDQIRAMTDDLFAAHHDFLPEELWA